MASIDIKVNGLDKLRANMSKLAKDLPVYLQGARIEVTDEILKEQGMRSYPPGTAANMPPTPYYIRGRGTQLASRNLGNSERLGTRWQSVPYGKIGMKIKNPASYAPYVHGKEQARAMGRIGWKILEKVAESKVSVITKIYNKWVDRLIKKHNL